MQWYTITIEKAITSGALFKICWFKLGIAIGQFLREMDSAKNSYSTSKTRNFVTFRFFYECFRAIFILIFFHFLLFVYYFECVVLNYNLILTVSTDNIHVWAVSPRNIDLCVLIV